MWTLREIESGKNVPCEITRMTSDQIAAARSSWGREFQRRHDSGAHDDDALIWARGLMLNAPSEDVCRLTGYVITAGNDVQGIVVLDEDLRASKSQPSVPLAYVRYLATAPWNRPCEANGGLYRGIGRLLVVHAITEGVALGCQGHIGLHSFVSAKGFYDRLGFKHLGVDPAERGMMYFELFPAAAHSLLALQMR